MSLFSAVFASDKPPENPWDSKPTPDSRPQSTQYPHQRQKRNGGNTPPPFPPFFKNLMDGNGEIPPIRIIATVGAAALVLWLASGLYRVQPEENAVVLRFGQYIETVTSPGLHYHLPAPFEMVLKPNVMFERRIEVGYRGSAAGNKQDVSEESMMLTGDANIVDLDFVVQWKISDAKEYLFNIREAQGTLKRVAESAMREVIGQNNLQDIITDKREDIAIRVKSIMQDILDSYGAGLMVTQVLIQDATVPAPVLDAFEDVIRATQQADTMRNQALRYRNEITPRAQGDAISMIKEAEGYKLQVVSKATGEAKRFNSVYEAYSEGKDVTKTRLYIDTWEDILRNNDAIIVEGGKNVSPLSYLNLNALKKTAAEKENQ